MNNHITIRQTGNALDISNDGKSELSIDIRAIIEPVLRYTMKKFMRGLNAYDLTGHYRPIREEQRLMFQYDKYGRMICGAGFLPRIRKLLTSLGYIVHLEHCDNDHERLDRFTEDWNNVANNFEFRAKQDQALIAIASNPRGLIEAPTGFGKTFLYRAIGLLYPKARIIITTKRKDLAESIQLYLAKYLPNIGLIGAGKNKAGRITIVTAGSLHKIDPDQIDIVIAEEVHELAARTYSAALAKFRFARMYGFSATITGRMDNADMKLESLFGLPIFQMSYQDAVDLNLVVPIHVKWLDVRIDSPCTGLVDIPRLRHGIWRNNERNQIIANAALSFCCDEQVLIMVTTFDHAVHLRQFLPDFTLCYAERTDDTSFERFKKNGMLPHDEPIMDSYRRQNLRQQFEKGELKKVIATDVWSTGVNFNQLAVLIRADARSSEIMDAQIPGRVCRLHTATNKQFGLVIDCLDQFDNGFHNASRKRKRNYESKGWIQEMPDGGVRERIRRG